MFQGSRAEPDLCEGGAGGTWRTDRDGRRMELGFCQVVGHTWGGWGGAVRGYCVIDYASSVADGGEGTGACRSGSDRGRTGAEDLKEDAEPP